MGELDGRVAIVTGASQGLGWSEVKSLAAAGAKVVYCARSFDHDRLLALRDEVVAAGGDCYPVVGDVTDKNDIDKIVQTTMEQYGRIDIMVNNAQMSESWVPLTEITDEFAMDALVSGPIAVLRFAQAVFPIMKEQGYGRIINFSSGAFHGLIPELGAYAMAKGGILGLTNVMSAAWAKHGITTNVIWPVIMTEGVRAYATPEVIAGFNQRPVGYAGEPDKDLGPVIVFIASEKSHYLTGMSFYVDGGVNGH